MWMAARSKRFWEAAKELSSVVIYSEVVRGGIFMSLVILVVWFFLFGVGTCGCRYRPCKTVEEL